MDKPALRLNTNTTQSGTRGTFGHSTLERSHPQEACKPLLQEIGLTLEQIQSFAHFKTQLFLPYAYLIAQSGISTKAVTGYYGNLQKMIISIISMHQNRGGNYYPLLNYRVNGPIPNADKL